MSGRRGRGVEERAREEEELERPLVRRAGVVGDDERVIIKPEMAAGMTVSMDRVDVILTMGKMTILTMRKKMNMMVIGKTISMMTSFVSALLLSATSISKSDRRQLQRHSLLVVSSRAHEGQTKKHPSQAQAPTIDLDRLNHRNRHWNRIGLYHTPL